MLKFNYSDLGLNVERIEGTVEEIVSRRMLLAMRVGETLCAEPGGASFLVAIDHLWFDDLLKTIGQTGCRDTISSTVPSMRSTFNPKSL